MGLGGGLYRAGINFAPTLKTRHCGCPTTNQPRLLKIRYAQTPIPSLFAVFPSVIQRRPSVGCNRLVAQPALLAFLERIYLPLDNALWLNISVFCFSRPIGLRRIQSHWPTERCTLGLRSCLSPYSSCRVESSRRVRGRQKPVSSPSFVYYPSTCPISGCMRSYSPFDRVYAARNTPPAISKGDCTGRTTPKRESWADRAAAHCFAFE